MASIVMESPAPTRQLTNYIRDVMGVKHSCISIAAMTPQRERELKAAMHLMPMIYPELFAGVVGSDYQGSE